MVPVRELPYGPAASDAASEAGQMAASDYVPNLQITACTFRGVHRWFRRFVRRLLFRTIHDVALMLDRERENLEQSPTAAVVDSQSIEVPAAEKRGFDAGKKLVGRKRHIAVDTDGCLLMVNLTTADIFDSAGAQAMVAAVRKRWPWLKHLFADGAYDRTRLTDAAVYSDFVLEIVRRTDKEPGFKVLPRRWVVE